jgi:hypothetical protein
VFKNRHGLPGGLLGLVGVAGPPVDAGQPAQVGAEGEGVAEGAAQGDGLALGGDGGGRVGDGVGLDGVAFEQAGEFGGVVAVPFAQDEPELGGGLAVGARGGGVLRRVGAVAGDGVLATGLGRVVDDTGGVGSGAGDERREDSPVEADTAGGGRRAGSRPRPGGSTRAGTRSVRG